MKKYLFVLILIVYMALSSIPCKAATVDSSTGSAVTVDTYFQKEFEDVSAKKVLNVYIGGGLVGFGVCSIVYIIGIAAGTAYSVLTKI